jgi:hypothetical protein
MHAILETFNSKREARQAAWSKLVEGIGNELRVAQKKRRMVTENYDRTKVNRR